MLDDASRRSLDYAFRGAPLVYLQPPGIDTRSLDYNFRAEPYVTDFTPATEAAAFRPGGFFLLF